MTVKVSVDVIIPVYRPDSGKLNRLLEALEDQTVRPAKVILIHTGKILSGEPKYKGKLVRIISEEEFDHGGSRNLGASLSDADAMVFMTQDAVPADRFLMERLLRALGEKGRGARLTAAAYARQIPCEDCRRTERYTREFNYPDRPEVHTLEDIPDRGIKTFYNSNVCSAYRREIFDRLGGFEARTIFNEDMLYAAKAVKAGYAVAYAAGAAVYHSHNMGLGEQFRRSFDNGVSHAEHPEVFEGISSEREGMKLVRYCAGRMKEDGRLYLMPYFCLSCGVRYFGFFLGERFRRLPRRLTKACSLNRRYWE